MKFHEADEYLCWQEAAFAPLLYVIQQGSVSLWDERASRLLDIRGPGDIIGLERFLGAAGSPYSAKANCDVLIYALPAADFQPLMDRYPPVARYVAAQATAGAIYRESGRAGVHETYVAEWSLDAEPSKKVVSPMATRWSLPALATGGSLTRTFRLSETACVLVVESSVTVSVTT
mgnify:CR=1 FL=1